MSVTERVMAAGEWSLELVEDTPRRVLEDIDIEFCEVTTSRVQHYGIDLNNFRYDSSQLQNLKACLPRDAKVTVKWARRNVGHVWIWDPISQEFFKALNREPDYEGVTLEQAKERIAALTQEKPEAAPDVAMMLDFLNQTSPQRGIIR